MIIVESSDESLLKKGARVQIRTTRGVIEIRPLNNISHYVDIHSAEVVFGWRELRRVFRETSKSHGVQRITIRGFVEYPSTKTFTKVKFKMEAAHGKSPLQRLITKNHE
jgi:hypothetical protein